jgi:hypothetical protein
VLVGLRDLVNGLRRQAELLDAAIEETEKEIDDLKIVQTRYVGASCTMSFLAQVCNASLCPVFVLQV